MLVKQGRADEVMLRWSGPGDAPPVMVSFTFTHPATNAGTRPVSRNPKSGFASCRYSCFALSQADEGDAELCSQHLCWPEGTKAIVLTTLFILAEELGFTYHRKAYKQGNPVISSQRIGRINTKTKNVGWLKKRRLFITPRPDFSSLLWPGIGGTSDS